MRIIHSPDQSGYSLHFGSYLNGHSDDPRVRAYFAAAVKHAECRNRKQKEVVASFDPSKLEIHHGAAWLVSLEYSGLTSDEQWNDKWNFGDEDGSKKKKREEERSAPPKQTFQLYCYIREGPEAGSGGDDSRHFEDFVGLPTWQQVREWVSDMRWNWKLVHTR